MTIETFSSFLFFCDDFSKIKTRKYVWKIFYLLHANIMEKYKLFTIILDQKYLPHSSSIIKLICLVLSTYLQQCLPGWLVIIIPCVNAEMKSQIIIIIPISILIQYVLTIIEILCQWQFLWLQISWACIFDDWRRRCCWCKMDGERCLDRVCKEI